MSVIKNFIMKIFNGSDWDIYHPETTAGMVKYTPSGSSEESDVKVQLDFLNSNLNGKQDSLIAGQFVEGFAGNGTLLMTWSKIGVSKKPSAVIITPCSSQDVIVSYNYDYNTAGTIQLRAYSTASGAAFSGALRFSMLVIQ